MALDWPNWLASKSQFSCIQIGSNRVEKLIQFSPFETGWLAGKLEEATLAEEKKEEDEDEKERQDSKSTGW